MMWVFQETIEESGVGWAKKGSGNSTGVQLPGIDFGFPPFTRAGFLTGAIVSYIEWGKQHMLSPAIEKLKEIMEAKCASECQAQKGTQSMATYTDESKSVSYQ